MRDIRPSMHVGQVSDHVNESATAAMACDDFDGLVTEQFQQIFPAMGHWKPFWSPRNGDHVIFLRLPNGLSEGFLLGGQYTAEQMPQGTADGLILVISDTGENSVRADAIKNTLDVIFAETITIKCKNLIIKAEENISIEAGQNISIKAGQDINIEAGNKIHCKAPTFIIDAQMQFNGNISHSGSMSTSGSHTDSKGPHCSC